MPPSVRICLLTGLLWDTAPATAPASRASDPSASTTALLVVDAQVGVLREVWETERMQRTLRHLVRRARSAGVPVIWVPHADDQQLQSGSDAWPLAPGFEPRANEPRVHKRYHSAFAEADLAQHLKAQAV